MDFFPDYWNITIINTRVWGIGEKIFGHVADFVVNEESWTIRQLLIDTVSFWPSKSVIISPEWVDSISWDSKRIGVSLTEEKIKDSAENRPEALFNRAYEEKLLDYYVRPKYWDQVSAPCESNTRETTKRRVS